MNISEWPLQQIMQLPDEAFGRRFIVSCQARPPGGATHRRMSSITLPEIMVVWELLIAGWTSDGTRAVFKIAMGNQVPGSDAEFMNLESMFPGLGEDGIEPRNIQIKSDWQHELRRLRFPVRTAGRQMVVSMENTGAASAVLTVMIVISSIPKDIPSWFGSG